MLAYLAVLGGRCVGLAGTALSKLASPSGTPQCVLKPLEVFLRSSGFHSKRAHEGLNYATPHVRSEPRGLCSCFATANVLVGTRSRGFAPL